jgi:hypothetical protein
MYGNLSSSLFNTNYDDEDDDKLWGQRKCRTHILTYNFLYVIYHITIRRLLAILILLNYFLQFLIKTMCTYIFNITSKKVTEIWSSQSVNMNITILSGRYWRFEHPYTTINRWYISYKAIRRYIPEDSIHVKEK